MEFQHFLDFKKFEKNFKEFKQNGNFYFLIRVFEKLKRNVRM